MTDINEHILCLEIILCILITSSCGLMCDNRCCLNFYKHKNGSCLDCPLGTFGVNCSNLCDEGFYGSLCKSKCNCLTKIVIKNLVARRNLVLTFLILAVFNLTILKCVSSYFSIYVMVIKCEDHFILWGSMFVGKQNFTGNINFVTRLNCRFNGSVSSLHSYEEDRMTNKSVWENVSFALVGCIVTVIATVGLVLLSSRFRKQRDGKHHKNTTVDESTSEDVQQLEPPVINISNQEMQDEVNENVYADLRSSKIIEFYGNDLSSDCSLTYSEDDKTDAFFQPKSDNRNYSQDSKDAKYKEKRTPKMNFQENVYGISRENGQYSVLSLRRNVDPSEMENFSLQQSIRRQFSRNEEDSYCIMNVLETDNQQNEEECKSDSDVGLTSDPYSVAMRK